MADFTGLAQHVLETFTGTFAGHFHQTERRHFANLGFGMILSEIFLQRIQQLTLVVVTLHIDKIDDDDSPEIAQPELSCNCLRCFHVGFENGFFKVLVTHKCARIDIDGSHRLGLIDDQVSTGLEANLSCQGTLQFFVNVVLVEQRSIARIVFDSSRQVRDIACGKISHFLKGFA